jgi:DNA (cytosine-5)-methyltransferase 1
MTNTQRVALFKPPYCVPSMAEIADVPLNGLTVATTFSGVGGTDLGFAMEGYVPIFATDKDPLARDSFLANHPRVPFEVGCLQHEMEAIVEKLFATGLKPGELDVLAGSPPCVVFSMASKRKFGERRKHAGTGCEDVIERLFYDFIKLAGVIRPKVVVAENVMGMIKGGEAQWYARDIAKRFAARGYRIEDIVLDARWLGVPQRRERVFIVGIREDLGLDPARDLVWPTPSDYHRYAVRDALPEVAYGEGWNYGPKHHRADEPAPTIMASDGLQKIEWFDASGNQIIFPDHLDLKRLGGFPDDFILPKNRREARKRIGNCVVPPMAAAIARSVRDLLLR